MVERIEINLLPAEYRQRPSGLHIPRATVYLALLALVLGVCAMLYTIYLNDKEASLKQEIEVLNKEIEANKHIQTEINKLRASKSVTEQKIRALERISVDREKWVRLLEILSGKLPTYTWLVSVREVAGPTEQLNIDARSYSFPEVAQYMTSLEETDYIASVALTGIEQISGGERKLYRFSLVCTLNKDVGLSKLSEDAEAAAGEPEQQAGARNRRAGRNR